jgi:hypothetical protein
MFYLTCVTLISGVGRRLVKLLCNWMLALDALLHIQSEFGIGMYVSVTHNDYCGDAFTYSNSLHIPVRWHHPR